MIISKWFDTFVDIEPSTYCWCCTKVLKELIYYNHIFTLYFINGEIESKGYENKQLAEYAAQECLKKIREEE